MSHLSELEDEVAATRERLNATIGEIQDRLTVSGMVNEVMGQTGVTGFDGGRGVVQDLLRRYPAAVMIAAAGIGYVLYRSNRKARMAETAIAVAPLARARRYDPDEPVGRARLEAVDGRDPVDA